MANFRGHQSWLAWDGCVGLEPLARRSWGYASVVEQTEDAQARSSLSLPCSGWNESLGAKIACLLT